MSAQQADQWAGNADAGISIVGSGYSGGTIVRGAPAVGRSASAVGGAAKTSTRFIADGAGNVLDTKVFQGLQEVSTVVKGGGRGGTQLPLFGKPGTYANLGNGHKIVYGADGRALFDVSTSRIKGIRWNQAPNGGWFPAKGSDTKFQGPVPQSVLNALGF